MRGGYGRSVMSRWIRPIDVVVFVAIPALVTVAVVATLFFEQSWPPVAVGFAVGVPLAAWIIAAWMLASKWNARPDFVLANGTGVWTNGLSIPKAAIMQAILFYERRVSELSGLPHADVAAALKSMRVEFTATPIIHNARRVAGLQQGRSVIVQWGGGFGSNAFFHELHHVVDQASGRDDHGHHRDEWWDHIAVIKREWRQT